MNVRCKLASNFPSKGRHGAEITFSAVYEGNAKLRRISENAMFGDSTPSAFLSLSGEFPVERFEAGEEYYVDMLAEHASDPHDGSLVRVMMHKIYQSEPAAAHYDQATKCVRFRFVSSERRIFSTLDMTIYNPGAIEALDAAGDEDWMVSIKVARGRRSDAEIAALEEEWTAEQARMADPKSYYATNPGAVENNTTSWLKRIARAKGEL